MCLGIAILAFAFTAWILFLASFGEATAALRPAALGAGSPMPANPDGVPQESGGEPCEEGRGSGEGHRPDLAQEATLPCDDAPGVAGLRVCVTGRDGLPVPFASLVVSQGVTAYPRGALVVSATEEMEVIATGTTNSQGCSAFTIPRNRGVRIEASLDGLTSLPALVGTLADDLEVNLALTPPSSLAIYVTDDQTGESIAGAEVVATPLAMGDRGRLLGLDSLCQTGADGLVMFATRECVQYRIRARATGYVTGRTYLRGDAHPAVIKLEKAVTVRVRVGTVGPDATVQLSRRGGGRPASWNEEEGCFEVSGLDSLGGTLFIDPGDDYARVLIPLERESIDVIPSRESGTVEIVVEQDELLYVSMGIVHGEDLVFAGRRVPPDRLVCSRLSPGTYEVAIRSGSGQQDLHKLGVVEVLDGIITSLRPTSDGETIVTSRREP